MSVYHARKHGAPLCGARGNGNRWNVITCSAAEWNALTNESRCKKCAAQITRNKA